jgi:5-methylthioadenosine/S-adenosylhomocysteine deaminase
VPFLRPVSVFVHQGQARDVEDVMVDGRWVMRDGVVLTMDEARVIREANEVSDRAWARLFAERPDIEIPEGFRPLPAAAASSGAAVAMHPVGPARVVG